MHEGSDVHRWRAAHGNLIDETIPCSATLHTLTGTVKTSVIAVANPTISQRLLWTLYTTKGPRSGELVNALATRWTTPRSAT